MCVAKMWCRIRRKSGQVGLRVPQVLVAVVVVNFVCDSVCRSTDPQHFNTKKLMYSD